MPDQNHKPRRSRRPATSWRAWRSGRAWRSWRSSPPADALKAAARVGRQAKARFGAPVLIAAGLLTGSTLWLASKPRGAVPELERLTSAPTLTVLVNESRARPHAPTAVLRGRTEASRRVRLRSRTEGVVEDTPVEKGSLIARDDVIVTIAMDDRLALREEAAALFKQRDAERQAAEKLAGEGFRSTIKLAEAETQLAAAKAALEARDLEVRHTAIKAPFAGILVERSVDIGQYLKNGDDVGAIVDLDPLLIAADVSERQSLELAAQQKISATLSDGRVLEGVISYIAAAADINTRTFRIEARAPNPAHVAPAGLSANIAVSLEAVNAHLVAPSLLTLNDDGILGVKAVDDDQRVVFYPVSIIDESSEGMWVTGPPDTITLIVRGHGFALTGETVNATSEPQPQPPDSEQPDDVIADLAPTTRKPSP